MATATTITTLTLNPKYSVSPDATYTPYTPCIHEEEEEEEEEKEDVVCSEGMYTLCFCAFLLIFFVFHFLFVIDSGYRHSVSMHCLHSKLNMNVIINMNIDIFIV